jgi:hypothetical protein
MPSKDLDTRDCATSGPGLHEDIEQTIVREEAEVGKITRSFSRYSWIT